MFVAVPVMMMTMIVVVIMPMMVVMIMVVVVMVGVVVVLVRIGVKLFRCHRLLGHLGELENVIDHLVLEDRRPELGEKLGVVAVIVVDFALLAWELPHALKQGAAHLIVGDGDLVAGPASSSDQPEPHTPRGDIAIFLARLLLGRALVVEAALRALEIGHHLRPDCLKLIVHERRRQFEAVTFIERVEERPFQLEA